MSNPGSAEPLSLGSAYARGDRIGVADRVRALSCGYQLHVSKPIDVHELIASVAALLSRRGTPPSA